MPTAAERAVAEVPIFWFAKLERAIEASDFAAAAEAQRQLERLGVVVRYIRPAPAPLAQPKLYEVPRAR